jgi:hypothetical protein
MIEKYIDKPWSWKALSNNQNLTIEIIEKYSDKPWRWDYISNIPNITMDFIQKHTDKSWDWLGILQNTFIEEKKLFYHKN